MNRFFKIALFFISFLPLWITILFIDIKSVWLNNINLFTELICVALISICFVISIIILFLSRKSIKPSDYTTYKIVNATLEKGITSEYLLSYILPLFVFDFTLWDSTIQFAFYFLVLSFLCIRNNNVYANILFELLGYKYFSCEVKDLSELSEKVAESIPIIVINKDSSLPSQKGNSLDATPLNKPFYLSHRNRG